ncbi:MAG: glutamate--tRNA ligase, partial [Desulfobacterales bacterium]|nr:glutamate--tRNA ligase [Desulfobacterales bacterium]
FEEKAAKKFLKPETSQLLNKCADALEGLADFSQKAQEEAFKQIMEETGLGFGKIAQPLRVAVTGTTVSPGIFEMFIALGKEKTVRRIRTAAQFCAAQGK